jgi:hypothetical protein
MLILREAQIAAFRRGALDGYVTELVDHCLEFSPHLCKTLRAAELRAAVEQGVERAGAHGFDMRGPIRYFVDLMIVLGGGFDTDPQYGWAAEILARKGTLGQMERAEALHARVSDHLARVDGEKNQHTRKALADLESLLDRGLSVRSVSPEAFEADTLELMTAIHPRKVAATDGEALRRLIADGVDRGQRRYGFREPRSLLLMVVMMFAFGHHVDTDPLLPWVARALRRRDPGTLRTPDVAELGAQRLERRARIWLSAVLRNTKEDD